VEFVSAKIITDDPNAFDLWPTCISSSLQMCTQIQRLVDMSKSDWWLMRAHPNRQEDDFKVQTEMTVNMADSGKRAVSPLFRQVLRRSKYLTPQCPSDMPDQVLFRRKLTIL